MNRTLMAATVYVISLFALGFVLGTIRLLFATPWMGELGATLMEVPLMLAAAYFFCRRAIERWQVPPTLLACGAMALWFLVLLALFETLVGVALVGQTLAGAWSGLATPAGLIGLIAQILAALLPLVVGRAGPR
ncbi:MAG: hypothetical protein ACK4ZW_01525 [Blastomonas sp.]